MSAFRPRAHPGTVALGGVVAASVGLVAGLLAAPAPRDPGVEGVAESWTAPTATVQLSDERVVGATPDVTPGAALTSEGSGKITVWECSPGSTIRSGTAPLVVDDRPVLALATSRPLWRDLSMGDEGGDVHAVQVELERLGLSGPPSGVFDTMTAAAVDAILDPSGGAPSSEGLPAEAVVWISAPEVTVESCDLGVGELVTPGSRLATIAGSLAGLQVELPASTGLVHGARSVVYGGSAAEVDPAPDDSVIVVDDVELLAAVAAGPDYQAWVASDGLTPVTVEYVLRAPVEVIAVPPGALFGLEVSAGCIRSGGRDHPVTVVASRAGQTFVVLDDGTEVESVDRAPGDPTRTCR